MLCNRTLLDFLDLQCIVYGLYRNTNLTLFILLSYSISKNAYWMGFLCTNGYIFHFLQLLLCCAEISIEKYPVWQLTIPSSLVFKQNFPNTNLIVNYRILIILINQAMVILTFVPIDIWYIILNELPYPIFYLRKICIFLWYFNKNYIVCPKCTAKLPFGSSSPGVWESSCVKAHYFFHVLTYPSRCNVNLHDHHGRMNKTFCYSVNKTAQGKTVRFLGYNLKRRLQNAFNGVPNPGGFTSCLMAFEANKDLIVLIWKFAPTK